MQPSTSVSLTPEPRGYRVGDLLIDIGRQRVTRETADLPLSQLSFELLLEAIQTAKYPDRPRAKPALDKFDSLDALRQKVQGPIE